MRASTEANAGKFSPESISIALEDDLLISILPAIISASLKANEANRMIDRLRIILSA